MPVRKSAKLNLKTQLKTAAGGVACSDSLWRDMSDSHTLSTVYRESILK